MVRWSFTIFQEILMVSLHIVSRIFNKHGLDKIYICRCWAIGSFIFQVKIASSISFKPIRDGRNSYSIIPVNNTNIPSIIFTITYFKAIKYIKCFLWLFILNSKKSFKWVTNEHTLKELWMTETNKWLIDKHVHIKVPN